MFSTLLDAVVSNAPEGLSKITLEQHRSILDEILPWLSLDSEPLLGAAKAVFGEPIFDSSVIGLEFNSTRPDADGRIDMPLDIGSLYIRPERGQQSLSLKLNIFRGFKNARNSLAPSVGIELEVWDLNAKLAVESLYKDYRGPINRLLEQAEVEFSTSYCSDIVGKSKSKKVSVLLGEYFSDPNVDNCFSLLKSCVRGVGYAVPTRAFLTLALLYQSGRAHLAGKSSRSMFERNLLRLI